jgi:hypothetical protein
MSDRVIGIDLSYQKDFTSMTEHTARQIFNYYGIPNCNNINGDLEKQYEQWLKTYRIVIQFI